jgi:transposase-like protein
MDPQSVFCPNSACPARGQAGRGNIQIHSQRERRYRCTLCGKTLSERRGTPFYRCRTDPEWITLALTLLAYGCPPLAIEKAFGFRVRTVRGWLAKGGRTAGRCMSTGCCPTSWARCRRTSCG